MQPAIDVGQSGKKNTPDEITDAVLLVIYGAGGHRSEMRLLLNHLCAVDEQLKVISMGPQPLDSPSFAHYQAGDIRDKHSRLKSLLFIFPNMLKLLVNTVQINRRYHVVGVLSTGPGLCIVPMLLMRVLGVKTVFLETYCRFNSRSLTGRVMNKVAHRFLVQNKSLQQLYPNSEYCGRL